jgi:hypothetical protein
LLLTVLLRVFNVYSTFISNISLLIETATNTTAVVMIRA